MSPTMCTFARAFDLSPVEVNVGQIRYLEGREHATAIHFGVGELIVVHGDSLSVAMRIAEASDKARPPINASRSDRRRRQLASAR